MRQRWYLLVIALICCSPTLAHGSGPKAQLIDYGLYYTNVSGTAAAPDTTTGKISLLRNPRLIRQTSTIPALPKSSFGIRYRLTGVPDGARVVLTDVVFTPGIREPGSDVPPTYKETWQDTATGGTTIYTGYTFDNAWEAVPGVWKIEIWHKEKQLLSREFRVIPVKPLRN